jgi:hypothetical protein
MSELSNRTFTTDELAKLREIIRTGVKTLQEIDDLRTSLNETVKHLAEEMDIKPRVINAAIKAKYRDDLIDKKENLDQIEDLIVMSKA